MVNIFAREITDDLISLIKKIDDIVAENQDKKMAAYLTLLTDDPAAAGERLKAIAEEHNIKETPLTVYTDTQGPKSYNLAEEADVTVLMWVQARVRANRALGKGELDDPTIAQIVEDASKILN